MQGIIWLLPEEKGTEQLAYQNISLSGIHLKM